jgi:hypothetical protein
MYADKPVYNYHPWETKKMVVVVDKWSLFRGNLSNKSYNWGLKMVVVIDRWSIFKGGR